MSDNGSRVAYGAMAARSGQMAVPCMAWIGRRIQSVEELGG